MQRYAWVCISSQVGAWFGILLARDTAILGVLEMVLMLSLGVNSIRIRAWRIARRARPESDLRCGLCGKYNPSVSLWCTCGGCVSRNFEQRFFRVRLGDRVHSHLATLSGTGVFRPRRRCIRLAAWLAKRAERTTSIYNPGTCWYDGDGDDTFTRHRHCCLSRAPTPGGVIRELASDQCLGILSKGHGSRKVCAYMCGQ
jgi:hypothetical protein